MSPYSSAHQGSFIVRQVCVHDRQITRESLRYYLGHTPFFSHGPWVHDDDRTECPDGPATTEAKLAAQLDVEPGGHDLDYDPAAP